MRIITIGDSRTTMDEWQPLLIAGLNSATHEIPSWSYHTNTNSNGMSVAEVSADINNFMGLSVWSLSYPEFVLMDFGEHDMVAAPGNIPDQTAFQNGYLTIVDAIHARWFSAKLFLDFPWTVPLDGAPYAAVKGYIQNVIAARSGLCATGVDQGVTIKGNDDGATNTSDNIHFSAAGNIVYAASLQTAMGY